MDKQDNEETSNFNKQQLEEIRKIINKIKYIYADLLNIYEIYNEKYIKELAITLYLNGIRISMFTQENYKENINLNEIVEYLIYKMKIKYNLINIGSYLPNRENIDINKITNNESKTNNVIQYHMIPKKKIRTLLEERK